MRLNSFARFFAQLWRRNKTPIQNRPRRYIPRVEFLEIREMLSAAPTIVQAGVLPVNGSTTANGFPVIQIQYSESMIDSSPITPGSATNPNSYVLLGTSGNMVPITAVTCLDSTVPLTTEPLNSTFQITYNTGNPGNQMVVDTYTLLVRGNLVLDSANGLPIANASKVVVGNSGNKSISVVNLPGNGTLGGESVYPLAGFGSQPVAVANGDFNGDGIKDLIVVDTGNNQVDIFAGHSAAAGGGYALAPSLTLNLPGGFGSLAYVTVGDFNKDGLLDFAVANDNGFSGKVTVFTNTTSSPIAMSFSSSVYTVDQGVTGITAGYFKGDSNLDLAVSVTSTFFATTPDINGDGNNDYRVDILPGNGAAGAFGAFVPVRVGDVTGNGLQTPSSIATGDFNSDGLPDLVVGGSNGLIVLTNTNSIPGIVSFAAPQSVNPGTGSANGSGFTDVVITTPTPHNLASNESVYISGLTVASGLSGLNNLTYQITVLSPTTFSLNGTFFSSGASPVVNWSLANIQSVGVGNLDAGGTPDIIATSSNGGFFNPDALEFILNSGSTPVPSFRMLSVLTVAAGTTTGQLVVGDLTGNGRADAVVTNNGNGFPLPAQVTVYLDGVMGGAINAVNNTNPAALILTSISNGLTAGEQIAISGAAPGLGINRTWTVSPLTGGITSIIGTGGSDITVTTNGNHQLTTGTQVTLAGVIGDPAANGTFTITVTGLNTFTLNGTAGAAVNDTTEPTATWTSKDMFALDPFTITAVTGTGTSDVSVTVAGNNTGLLLGDNLQIAGLTGTLASSLNGNSYTISNVVVGANSTSFTLNGTSALAGADTGGTASLVTGGGAYGGGASWVLTGINASANGPGAGAPVTITTASTAGLATGDSVTITGAAGFAAINNKTYTITVTSPTSFMLTGTGALVGNAAVLTWTVKPSVYAPAVNTYGVDSNPEGVTLVDTNQDGVLDIVTANNNFNGDFSLVLGKGDGTFQIAANTTLNNNAGPVAVGDLNGDGLPDLVAIDNAGGTAQIAVFAGLVGGGFSPVPLYYNLGTFRTLSSIAIGTVVNQGQGNPAKTTNLPDIIFTDKQDSTLGILVNKLAAVGAPLTGTSFALSSPAGVAVGAAPTQVAIGDFNNDGNMDLVVSHQGTGPVNTEGVTYLQGGGDGTFQPGVEYDTGAKMAGIVVGDFNKDGKLDYIALEDTGFGNLAVIHAHNGDGKGGFGAAAGLGTTFTASISSPTSITSADFNNDGYADVLITSADTGVNGGISVQLNQFGAGFGTSVQTPAIESTSLQSAAVTDVNDDGIPDILVTTQGNAPGGDNVFVLIGNGDGSFQNPVPYTVGAVGSFFGLSPSYVAVTPNPLTPVTTFTPGGDLLRTNLITNGSFGARDLTGAIGSLAGWKTYTLPDVPGSAGSWNVQTGNTSPLSGTAVPPPSGGYRAMLDQYNPIPYSTVINPNSTTHALRSQNYGGSHALYQDITIPANASSATLSLALYVDNSDNGGAYSNPVANPSLDWRTALNNQQVRVDFLDPTVTPASNAILGGVSNVPAGSAESADGVLRTEFITSQTSAKTFSLTITDANLLAFAGKTIRLRVAAVNNDGRLLVGVGSVSVKVQFHDATKPTLSGVKIQSPEFYDVNNVPHTNDSTIFGTIADTFGLGTIAYVAFDPAANDPTFTSPSIVTTNQWDATGDFSFTLPNPVPGLNTVDVRVVDKAGDFAEMPLTFFMQTSSVSEWQAIGPQGIDVSSQPNVNYTKISGRVTSTIADITDPSGNTLFAGSANGGIWKTTDGGNNWVAETPSQTDGSGNAVPVPIASITQGYVKGIVNVVTGDGINPVVVTTTAHTGMATGDQVTISGVAGFAINGTYTITMVGGSGGAQFTLNGTAGRSGIDSLGQGVWTDNSKTVLVAATGIGDQNLDSRPGIGVLKSIDDGVTWTLIGNSNVVLAGARTSKIVIDSDDSNNIYVGVASGGTGGTGPSAGPAGPGVYKSADGGLTWNNVLNPANMFLAAGGTLGAGTPLASVTDLAIDPFDPKTLLVGLGNISPGGSLDNINVPFSATAGLWHSINGGGSWDQIIGNTSPLDFVPNHGLPSGAGVGRVTIAMGNGKAGDEHYVYVLISNPPAVNTPPTVLLGTFNGLYKTSSNNLSASDWTKVMLKQRIFIAPPPQAHNFVNIDLLGDNGANVGSLVVDPNNPNVVIVGGTQPGKQFFGTPNHDFIYVDTGDMQDANHVGPIGVGIQNDGDDIQKWTAAYYPPPGPPAPGLWYPGGAAAAPPDPYKGEGVYWYDLNEAISGTSSIKNLLPPQITSLSFDPRGRLLVGTNGGIWRGTDNGFGYDFTSGGQGILSNTAPIPIAAATWAGNVATITAPNSYTVGETVNIFGVTPFGYNGFYTVTFANAFSFKYNLFFNPGGPGTAFGTATGNNAFTTQGMQFTSLNGNLQISDMTSTAIDPNNPGLYYSTQYATGVAGSSQPLVWVSQGLKGPTIPVFGNLDINTAGAVLPANPTPGSPAGTPITLFRVWQYANTQALIPETSVNNGATWTPLGGTGALPLTPANVFPGFAVNPTPVLINGVWQTELMFGTQTVYLSRTSGIVWSTVPTANPGNTIDVTGGVITAMSFAPSVDGILYVGTNNGEVFYNNTNGGAGWQLITPPGVPATTPITGISVDPNNANEAFVMVGGSGILDHVYKTTNAGGLWTDVSTALPHVPAYSMVIDRTVNLGAPNGKLYLATEVGVFTSLDDGTTWTRLGLGMPNVPVVSLSYSPKLQTLAAATLGRGVFTINTAAISVIANQTILENSTPPALPFTINDPGLPAGSYTVSATSSNQNLIPNGNLTLGGAGANRTIQFTPALNAYSNPVNGQGGPGIGNWQGPTPDTITVTLTNGANVFTQTFTVTVNFVNVPPTITPIADQTVTLNQATPPLPFTISDIAIATCVVTATSSNTTLVPNANLVLTGAGTANQTLTITPAMGQIGTSVITLSVTDSHGLTTTETFNFLVTQYVSLPYSDNFNRPNNAILGPGWNENVGNIAISNNQAFSPLNSGVGIASLNFQAPYAAVTTNVALQADVIVPAGGNAGLIARYAGAGDKNYYEGGIYSVGAGYEADIYYTNAAGVRTKLAFAPVASGTGTLLFDVAGPSLKLFYGPNAASLTLATYADDQSLAGPGTVGLRTAGGTTTGVVMDNFSAAAINLAITQPLPFSDPLSANPAGFNQLNNINWTELAGNFKLATGQAIGQAALNLAVLNGALTPVGNPTQDMSVQANIAFTAVNQMAGLVARYTGPTNPAMSEDSNMYQANATLQAGNNLQVVIAKNVNGTLTPLRTTNVFGGGTLAGFALNGGGGLFRFTVVGQNLSVSLAGTTIATVTDASLTKGTAGMRMGAGTQVTNFVVNTVPIVATTTSLSVSNSNPNYGQAVTFTATVSAGSGSLDGGTVNFLDGGTVIGTGTPLSGTGTLDTSTYTTTATQLGVGPHSITASYGPVYAATNFGASVSAPAQTVTVKPVPTTITSFTASPTTIFAGQTISFTAVAAIQTGGTGTISPGSITFTDTTTSTVLGTINVSAQGKAILSTTTMPAGANQNITATYNAAATNATLASFTSAPITVNSYRTSTMSVLTSAPNPSSFAQTVNFNVTVTGAGGPPTGTVNIYDGTVITAHIVATGTLSGGSVMISLSTLSAGSHNLTVSYMGDNTFSPTSRLLVQTVKQAATTTALQGPLTSIYYGQQVTYTATVTATAGAVVGSPTGSVTFKSGTQVLGVGTLSALTSSSSIATYTPTPAQAALLPVGNDSISAWFATNGSYAGSNSTASTQQVAAVGTQTQLQISNYPYGSPTPFTATVTAQNTTQLTPTGTVTFKDGNVTLGSVTLTAAMNGVAVYTPKPTQLAIGSNHKITAVYTSNTTGFITSNSGPAQTLTVTAAPNITLASTPAISYWAVNQPTSFTASIVVPGYTGTLDGSVTFVDNDLTNNTTTPMGTVPLSGGKATIPSYTFTTLASHSVTVTYNPGPSASAFLTSPPYTFTTAAEGVYNADSVALTASATNNITFGTSIMFTATISSSAGTPTNGTVTFTDTTTGQTLGSTPLNGSNVATFSYKNLGVGTHKIIATYSGDGSMFDQGLSNTLSVTVVQGGRGG